jgi:hypothetical protein
MTEIYTHRELSAAPVMPSNNNASGFERFMALLLIVFFSAIGGFFVKILSKG